MLITQVVAGEAADRDFTLRFGTFLADILALARAKAGEKIIKAFIVAIDEMKLPVAALQQARFFRDRAIVIGQKGQMRARAIELFRRLHHRAQRGQLSIVARP